MLKPLANALLRRLGYRIDRRIDVGETPAAGLEADLALTEGMISVDEARLLHGLAREARRGCIVEIGSFRGRSSVALARGSSDGHGVAVYAIDPHVEFEGALGGSFGPADRAAFMRAMLDTGHFRTTRLVNLPSHVAAAGWEEPIAVLWIDGDHSEQGTRTDFEAWSPHLLSDAPVAFDDSLDPGLGPYRLIEELVASGRWVRDRTVGKITVLRPRTA